MFLRPMPTHAVHMQRAEEGRAAPDLPVSRLDASGTGPVKPLAPGALAVDAISEAAIALAGVKGGGLTDGRLAVGGGNSERLPNAW